MHMSNSNNIDNFNIKPNDIAIQRDKVLKNYRNLLSLNESANLLYENDIRFEKFNIEAQDFQKWCTNVIERLSVPISEKLELTEILLQAYRDIEMEIENNVQRFQLIEKEGNELLRCNNHFEQTSTLLNSVMLYWKELNEKSKNRSLDIESVISYVKFKILVEDLISWTENMKKIVDVKTEVSNLKQAEIACRNIEYQQKDIDLHSHELSSIKHNAEVLLNSKHKSSEDIVNILESVNESWNRMVLSFGSCKAYYENELQIYQFLENVKRLINIVEEKQKSMILSVFQPDSLVKEEGLTQQLDFISKEYLSIKNKVDQSVVFSKKLKLNITAKSDFIQSCINELLICLENYNLRVSEWKVLMKHAISFEKYRVKSHEHLALIDDYVSIFSTQKISHNLSTALSALQNYDLIIKSMENFVTEMKLNLLDGDNMIKNDHYASSFIIERNKKVLTEYELMLVSSIKAKVFLERVVEGQRFLKDAHDILSILSKCKNFCTITIRDKTKDELDSLIQKYDDLMEYFKPIGSRIKSMENSMNKMKSEECYLIKNIEEKYNEIIKEFEIVENYHYKFRKEIMDVIAVEMTHNQLNHYLNWMKKQLQSFEDNPLKINIGDRLEIEINERRMDMIENEFKNNFSRLNQVIQRGKQLTQTCEGIYLAPLDNLLNITEIKSQELRNFIDSIHEIVKQSHIANVLYRGIDDFHFWIRAVELQSINLKNLRTTLPSKQLEVRIKLMKSDVDTHKPNLVNLKNSIKDLVAVSKICTSILEEDLHELEIRMGKLDDTLFDLNIQLKSTTLLQGYDYSIQDEMIWMKEKQVNFFSVNVGCDLESAQDKYEKFISFKDEMNTHSNNSKEILEKCDALLKSNFIFADELAKIINEFNEVVNQFYKNAMNHENILKNSMLVFKWLEEVSESRRLLLDRQEIISNLPSNTDEVSFKWTFAKIDSLLLELGSYKSIMKGLKSGCFKLKSPMDLFNKENLECVETVLSHASKQEGLNIVPGQKFFVLNKISKEELLIESGVYQEIVPSAKFSKIENYNIEDVLTRIPSSANLMNLYKNLKKCYKEVYAQALMAKDILIEKTICMRLNQLINSVDLWMQSKMKFLTTITLDASNDNIETLIEDFTEFDKGLNICQAKMDEIQATADKLKRTPDLEDTRVNVESIKKAWYDMINQSAEYRKRLYVLKDIYKLKIELEDLLKWVNENDYKLQNAQTLLLDQSTIKSAQTALNEVESNIAGVGNNVMSVLKKSSQVIENDRLESSQLVILTNLLGESWPKLVEKCKKLSVEVDIIVSLSKFRMMHKDTKESFVNFLESMKKREGIQSYVVCESLIFRHQEQILELETFNHSIVQLEEIGQDIIQRNRSSLEEITTKLRELHNLMEDILRISNERKIFLNDALEKLILLRNIASLESQINNNEKKLKDLQSNRSDVSNNVLTNSHIYTEKLRNISESNVKLNSSDNAELSLKIKQLSKRIDKYNSLVDSCKETFGVMIQQKQFELDMDDLRPWLFEKNQILSSELNLTLETIKREIFNFDNLINEVKINEDRLISLKATMNSLHKLKKDNHTILTDDHIKMFNETLQQWNIMIESLSKRQVVFKLAKKYHHLYDSLFECISLINEVESKMNLPCPINDLPSAKGYIQSYQLMNTEIDQIITRINSLENDVLKLHNLQNLQLSFKEKAQSYIQFADINLLKIKERLNKMNISLKFFALLKEVDTQFMWANNKIQRFDRMGSSNDLKLIELMIEKIGNFDKKLKERENIVKNLTPTFDSLMVELSNTKDLSLQVELVRPVPEKIVELGKTINNLKIKSSERTAYLTEIYKILLTESKLVNEQTWCLAMIQQIKSAQAGDDLESLKRLEKDHNIQQENINSRIQFIKEFISQISEEFLLKLKHLVDPLKDYIIQLTDIASKRHKSLRERLMYLDFCLMTDVNISWMDDRKLEFSFQQFDFTNFSQLDSYLLKLESLEKMVDAFKNDNIDKLTKLKIDMEKDLHIYISDIIKKYNNMIEKYNDLNDHIKDIRQKLKQASADNQKLQSLFLLFARKASEFNSWYENVVEDLTEPIRCSSTTDVKKYQSDHKQMLEKYNNIRNDLIELEKLQNEIDSLSPNANNTATWFTYDNIQEMWKSLQALVEQRNVELKMEETRQENLESLCKKFIEVAKMFSSSIKDMNTNIANLKGSLTEQLSNINNSKVIVDTQMKDMLVKVEKASSLYDENLVHNENLNQYSLVNLCHQYDSLKQKINSIQINLEQMISSKLQTGVSDERITEAEAIFLNLSQNNSTLGNDTLKQCLTALGYADPFDETILQSLINKADPNNTNSIDKNAFIKFVVSHESTKVDSITEIINAFTACTEGSAKPFITEYELFQALGRDLAQFCLSNMKPFVDEKGTIVPGSRDYKKFCTEMFV